jgi:hypothetical protein
MVPDRGDFIVYKALAKLFERELELAKNDVCRQQCDAKSKIPQLPWYVGESYAKQDRRLVILRDTHRSDQRASKMGGLRDPRELTERLLWNETKANWSYIYEFLELLHGDAEEGLDAVAMTSIVKCTNVGRNNPKARRSSEKMRESCIRTLGVIGKELELLAPTHVLAILDATYDPYLNDLRWAGDQVWWNLNAPDNTVKCGKVTMAWFERELVGLSGRVRFVRVAPPQGKPREPYLRRLHQWVTVGEPVIVPEP